MRVDDFGRAAGARRREEYDGSELPPRRELARRHPAVAAVAVGLAVILVSVGIVTVTRGDRGPAADGTVVSRLVSFTRAFGRGTAMTDVEGFPAGFVASGATPHRCRHGAPVWSCESAHLWFSPDGTRWREVEPPGVASARSTVTLGRFRNRTIAAWRSASGLAAAWSDDGIRWHRAVVRDAAVPTVEDSEEPNRFPGPASFDIGRWSGGLVVSALLAGLQSWTSPDGEAFTRAPPDTEPTTPTFTFPQGVRLGDRWIGLALPGGSLSNGDMYEPPQVMTSKTGRGWRPIQSDIPEQMRRQLTPDAHHRFAVAAQFHVSDAPSAGCALYRTSDGRNWDSVVAFNRRPGMRRCAPYEIARSGRWWVVSGTRPDGDRQQAVVWMSPDLSHWTTRPAPVIATQPEMLGARGRTVIAIPRSGRWLRVIRLDG